MTTINVQQSLKCDWRGKYETMLVELASAAHSRMMRDMVRLYAIVRPADGSGAWGALGIIGEQGELPDIWQYLVCEPLPMSLEVHQLAAWLKRWNAPVIGN
jgi:hypothetical protein